MTGRMTEIELEEELLNTMQGSKWTEKLIFQFAGGEKAGNFIFGVRNLEKKPGISIQVTLMYRQKCNGKKLNMSVNKVQ